MTNRVRFTPGEIRRLITSQEYTLKAVRECTYHASYEQHCEFLAREQELLDKLRAWRNQREGKR